MGIDLIEEPEEWIDAWQAHLNQSEEYDEAGEDWGVDFNGSFIFELEPDAELEEPKHFYIEPVDGTIEEARLTETPEEDNWGFWFSGPFSNWKKLIRGELGAMDGMMSGAFSLEGDMQIVLQYSQAATVMTGAANEVPTDFPDE